MDSLVEAGNLAVAGRLVAWDRLVESGKRTALGNQL